MCNMDCFNCQKVDCENDHITDAERKQQDAYDRECIREHIQEERSGLRKHELKYYDYNHSEKGKAARKRYEQSERGREVRKRINRKRTQKQIASGKNAEYCRAYYQRRKQRLQEQKEAAGL